MEENAAKKKKNGFNYQNNSPAHWGIIQVSHDAARIN